MGRFVKKADKIQLDRKLIEGLQKNLGAKEILFLGGTKISRDKLIAIVREQIELSIASRSARFAWIEAARRETAFARKHKELRDLLAGWIRIAFGASRMQEFGLEPHKKRRKLTLQEKKQMVEKMRATRAARRPAKV